MNKGLTIKLSDDREDKKEVFFFEGGIRSFVEHLNRNKETINPDTIYFNGSKGTTVVDRDDFAVDGDAAVRDGGCAFEWWARSTADPNAMCAFGFVVHRVSVALNEPADRSIGWGLSVSIANAAC